MFLTDAAHGVRALAVRVSERARITSFAMVAVLAVGQSAATTIVDTRRMIQSDSRLRAGEWIDRNARPGSRIAIEAYAPFIDPTRFRVDGFTRITEHELSWYQQNGFDYLVLSQGMYGRFFRERERYPTNVAEYEALFTRLTPAAIFPDRDNEVRVYRIHDDTMR